MNKPYGQKRPSGTHPGPNPQTNQPLTPHNNDRRPYLRLAPEPAEEVLADDYVEGHRHLVEEEDLEGSHEPQEELHAAALC